MNKLKIIVTIADSKTVSLDREKNIPTFWVLTPAREHSGSQFHETYFKFSGDATRATKKKAFEHIAGITGSASPDFIKIYEVDAKIYYHLHYSSFSQVNNLLFSSEPAKVVALPPRRHTRTSTKVEYRFVKRADLLLSPEDKSKLTALYDLMHKKLFCNPKRLGASWGGAAGRSVEWRPPVVAGSAGFSMLNSNDAILNKIYNYFYESYNKKIESFFFSSHTALTQSTNSPTKRSPGLREYSTVLGMGIPVYVTTKPSKNDTEAVKLASSACPAVKKLQFDSADSVDFVDTTSSISPPTVTAPRATRNRPKKVLFHHVKTEQLSCPEDFNENTKLTHVGAKSDVEKEEANKAKINQIVQNNTLTRKKLQKCKKEKEVIGYKRRPGQSELFGCSADKAALACGIDDGLSREWTHLIAHEFLGNKLAQTKDNLVLASYACNTAMMHLEYAIKKLLLAKNNIQVVVSAQPDNSSAERIKYHCVKDISYVITINGKKIGFSFDPYLKLNPPKNLWRGIMAKIVSELIYTPSPDNIAANTVLNYDECTLDLKELETFINQPLTPIIPEPIGILPKSDLGKRKYESEKFEPNKMIALDSFEADVRVSVPVAPASF